MQKISMLRRLGLNIEQIRAVLADTSALQRLSIQRELLLKKEQQKKKLLEQLSFGRDYREIIEELNALDQNLSIAERLYDAFPGFYGRYICLHFACFLTSKITTEEQGKAYRDLTRFLDSVPDMPFPQELKEYLDDAAGHLSAEQLLAMTENLKKAAAAPEDFLSDNREILDWYCAYTQSEEYKASPAFRLKEQLHAFNTASGYYDTFLPAMKKLSPEYAAYCSQLENANQVFLKEYPEFSREGIL